MTKIKRQGDDDLHARVKWICGEEFLPRPENISGLPRMELARTKCDGVHMLVIYNRDTRTFYDRDTMRAYGAGALEVKVTCIV